MSGGPGNRRRGMQWMPTERNFFAEGGQLELLGEGPYARPQLEGFGRGETYRQKLKEGEI